MDFAKAVNGCDSQLPVILMAHNPKAAKVVLNKTSKDQRIDLILCGQWRALALLQKLIHHIESNTVTSSGHTHAGQLYVMAPVMYLLSPFFYGLYQIPISRSQVLVTSGVHYWAAPMKMAGFAEIVIITLV